MLLERQRYGTGDLLLLGYGESSDAYHMSTPHPEGRGAAAAMERALDRAGIKRRPISTQRGEPTRDRDAGK